MSRQDAARRAAVEALESALAPAIIDGRLLLLTGDAGIGKTTLAKDLAQTARRRGATVRWSACWAEGRTIAHGPWLTALDGLGAPGEEAATLLRGAAELDASAAGAARASAYAAVIAGLARAAAHQPVVLVIDDLHWADEGSLALLTAVAAHLPGMPVIIIGTYRDTEVRPGSALTRLGGGPDRFSLVGLAEPAVAELLAEIVGERGTELAAPAIALTSGNPFLLVQLGRLWASDAAALARGRLPSGAQALLDERLSALSVEDRQVLAAAAVLGSPFRHAELEALQATDPAAALERAAALRIVERTAGTGAWAFVHDLFRQAALAALRDDEREVANARAADVLAGAGAEPAVVARHLLAAGPARSADAAAWCVRAGDQALAALAWEEAIAHYERALGTLPADDAGPVRQDALFGLGRGRLIVHDAVGAARAFEELAALGRKIGAHDVVVRAALGFSVDLAGFEVRLFDQRQIDLLEEAAGLLDPDRDPALLASVLARASVALSLTASDVRRRELAERAVALAQAADDPRVLAHALAAHCDAIAGPSNIDRREQQASTIIAIAEQLGDGPLELLGRRLRYVARLERGDPAGVEEDMAAFARRAEAVGNPIYSWYVPQWRAQAAVNVGDLATAEALLAEVEDLGAQAGSTNAPMLAMVLRLVRMWRTGDFDAAAQAIDRLGELSPDLVDYISSLGAFARTAVGAGRPGQANGFLDRIAALGLANVPNDAEYVSNLVSALAAATQLQHPLLTELIERAEPYADVVAFEGIGAGLHGACGRFLAEAYLSTGRTGDAVRAARAALVVNRRLGGALTADAQRTLATCLGATGDPGDADEARALHAAADEGYRAYGLVRFVRTPSESSPDPRSAAESPTHDLLREGDVWRIAFRGETAVVKHSKGVADLAVLLARPGREVHVTELAQSPAELADQTSDPALDQRALTEYKQRLGDLGEEIDEADAQHDLARASRLREEYDALVTHLSSAMGLGGRTRAAGSDPQERMRKAVTARVRDAIRRIGEQSPALGRHLTASVRTGIFCSYQPEAPVVWHCQP